MARSERVEFPGSQDATLAARLERPDDDPVAHALFAHCFTCSKDLGAVTRISRALADHGYGVLRFDFTGLGHSEGEFENTNFSSNVEDLRHAAAWLEEEYEPPRLLIGHSLGGAAVLAAARSIEGSRAVATIGAPADPTHVEKLLDSSKETIEREGEAEVVLAGRRFRIRRQFLEDLREHGRADHLASLGRALMIFHAPLDEIVDIDNAATIYSRAKHPKSFVSIDGADHLLSRARDAEFVAQVLAAWADRYVNDD